MKRDSDNSVPRFALRIGFMTATLIGLCVCLTPSVMAQGTEKATTDKIDKPTEKSEAEKNGKNPIIKIFPLPDISTIINGKSDHKKKQEENTLSSGEKDKKSDVDEKNKQLTAEEREELKKRLKINPSLTLEEREAILKRLETGADETDESASDAENASDSETSQEDDERELAGDNLLTRENPVPNEKPAQPSQEAFTPYSSGESWNSAHPDTEDPYAQLGLRAGSFIIYPELIVEGLHDDNVFLDQNNTRSDRALQLRPTIEFESDWTRHALSGSMTGTFNYHDEYDTEDEEEYSLQLRGRIDLTKRTNVEGSAGYDITQEGRSSIDLPGGAAERTNIETYEARGAFNHRFNRLSVSIRGALEDVEHEDTPLIGGGVDNNSDRDYREHSGILRLSYDFKPGLAIFAEGEIGNRDYDVRIDDDGYQRSSDRHAFRGGILLDIGPKLAGEIGVGQAWQSPDDARLADVDGVVLNALLTWRPREATTVTFRASSDIEETTFDTASAIFERFYAAEIRHQLRRHLILTAGVSYQTEDYRGTSTEERTWNVDVGGEYLLSRHAAVLVNYGFEKAGGDGGAQKYQQNEVRVGVRLRP